MIDCKSSNASLEKNGLNKTYIEFLGGKLDKLLKEDQLTTKQFISKNGCNKEETSFAKRAMMLY
ncbi:hypothetical protein [Lacinutrix sp.]|uniref:hypothetical protein n=1 Tax=Lacinutrix sp. TaxID=1937692 RepID=UPI0025BDC773|nr:hypothetical protein [Lacinutrix sp.]